jgi:hypothetical protein
MTNNVRAVRKRSYGCLESVSDAMLLIMLAECRSELELLTNDLRASGAIRNGTARIELEAKLRGIV